MKTVGDVERGAKIRAICLNIFCVHSLICLFVWRRLLPRCACPTLASLFCSSCTPPLQMAWRIQLDMPRADSLIEAASLSLCVFFISLRLECSSPERAAQHLLSPHLPVLLHASSSHHRLVWSNTAPTGVFGSCSTFSTARWRADCDLLTDLRESVSYTIMWEVKFHQLKRPFYSQHAL